MITDFITSRFRSTPVELYQFIMGPRTQDTKCYSDGEQSILFGGRTYNPVTIRRGNISNSGSLDKSSMEVEMPMTMDIPQLFRIYPPGFVITLTIFQGDANDPDTDFRAIWSGRVLGASYEGLSAKLDCQPISTAFRRSGLRRNYQYLCPHVLFGPQCGANRLTATSNRSVNSLSGRVVIMNSLITDHERYVGGELEWDAKPGVVESRTILSVSTTLGFTAFTLTGLPTGLAAGDDCRLVLGCRHTMGSCRDDHNNINAFGGWPWIPLKNPIGNVSPFN